MPTFRFCSIAATVASLVAFGLGGSLARGQPFPSAPVRIITQQGAGGGTDVAMRLVAEELGKVWGQHTLLINQPGAGGALAARTVAEAPADGHTLFLALASAFVVLPEVQRTLPFNVNEFAPIAFIGEAPMAIAVSPSLPVQGMADLIALSRREAGGLNVAVAFRGGIPHLTMELLRSRANAALTAIFYPSSAQSLSDVATGRVPVIIEGLGGPVGSGQVKVLAVASPQRLNARLDVATVAEVVPGFAASGWYVLVAPRGTPASVITKVNKDVRDILARPDIKRRLNELGSLTRDLSPDEVAAFIRSEQQLWRPVVQRLGLAQ